MNSPQMWINKIGFATRIMRAATAATALQSADRSKPTTEQIQLAVKEAIAEVWLPYDVIEANIERGNIGQMTDVGGSPTSGGIKDTIMTLIAERAAVDLEELAILGDTASSDTYLALVNGWLKSTAGQYVDAGGQPISRRVLTDAMKVLPPQYRRNRAALRHYVSTEQELDYRETLAQRETSVGDAQLQSTAPVYAAGAPVEGVALMPGTKGLLTNAQNLIFGIQRQIHVESDKDIRARVYIIVLTFKVDFKVEEPSAAVQLLNLGS
jgi:hypothetical protein